MTKVLTDRELLELAAKAAEIEVFDDEHGETWRVYYTDPNNGLNRYTRWCPLTDDGDSRRLEVKLGLTVYQWSDEVCVCNEKGTVNENVARVGDIYEATRRAIVLAAAEIGRNKA